MLNEIQSSIMQYNQVQLNTTNSEQWGTRPAVKSVLHFGATVKFNSELYFSALGPSIEQNGYLKYSDKMKSDSFFGITKIYCI